MHNRQPYDEMLLLRSTAEGDQSAFATLFHHYRNKIFTVACKLTASEEAAEEIVQDVFMKVWHKRSTLADIERFDAWLFIIARNTIYSFLRITTAKTTSLDSTDETSIHAALSNDIIDRLEEKELRRVLQKAVDRLSPQQKQVYLLSREAGLKQQEIADKMQIAPQTVKKHLQYALRSIRAYLLSRSELGLILLFLWKNS